MKKIQILTTYPKSIALKCELHDCLVELFRQEHPELRCCSDEEMLKADISFYHLACAVHDFDKQESKDFLSFLEALHKKRNVRNCGASYFVYRERYLLRMLIIYVRAGYEDASHLIKLRSLLSALGDIKFGKRNPGRIASVLLNSEEIEDYFYVRRNSNGAGFYKLSGATRDKFITEMFVSAIEKEGEVFSNKEVVEKAYSYFQKFVIDSPEDVTPELLMNIIDLVWKDSEGLLFDKLRNFYRSVLTVCVKVFVRCMVNFVIVRELFDRCDYLCPKLLIKGEFINYYLNGYEFLPFIFDTGITWPEKIVFTVRAIDRWSTSKQDHDFFTVDMCGLCDQYRNCLIKWAFSLRSLGSVAYSISYISRCLFSLQEHKKENNENLGVLTLKDIAFMTNYRSAGEVYSVHAGRHKVKSFLDSMNEDGLLVMPSDYSVFCKAVPKGMASGGEGIDKEVLKKLETFLRCHAEESRCNKVHYCLFGLLCRLSFRISQLASLKITDIKSTAKPNEFKVLDESKTSGGEKNKVVILKNIRDILVRLYEEGEPFRLETANRYLDDAVFIYKNTHGVVTIPNTASFRNYLRKACCSLGIPCITASNLRCTFITNVKSWGSQNDISPMVTDKMTDHRGDQCIYENYYDRKIAVEDDAEIEITGNFTSNLHIAEKIQDIPLGLSRLVQGGAGYCRKESNSSCPPTCLICKDFITTIDHLPYFKSQITELKRLKREAVTKHDSEDIDVWLELYASYELAIIDKISSEVKQ